MKPTSQFAAELREKLMNRLEGARSASSFAANFFRKSRAALGVGLAALVVLIAGSVFFVEGPSFFGEVPVVKAGSQSVPVNFPVRMKFTHDISQETLQKYFAISPATEGAVFYKDGIITFDHPKFLNYKTEYVITVSKEASSAMTEDFSLSFTTRDRFRTELYLASRLTLAHYTLNSYEPEPIVFLRLPYTGNYTAKLYRIEPEQMLDFIVAAENYNFEGKEEKTDELMKTLQSRLVDTQKLAAKEKPEARGDSAVLDYAPKVESEGIYFVELFGQQHGEYDDGTYRFFLNYSKYAMSSKRLREKLVTWLVDTKSAQGVAGASVKAYGPKKQVMYEKNTDASGIIEMTVPQQDFENQPRLLVVDTGTEKIVQLLRVSWMSIFDGDYSNTARPYAGSVVTDRPLYMPGDTVRFKAMLRKANEPDYDGSIAKAKVEVWRDAYGQSSETLFKSEYDVSSMGTFAGEFPLGKELKTGEYALIVKVGDKEALRSIFQVEVFQKPEFEVSVKPEREMYVSGDTVKVEVSARYFFGEPVKNQKVDVEIVDSYYWGESMARSVSGTLDSAGRFTAEFKDFRIAKRPYYYYGDSQGIPLSIRARVSENTGKSGSKSAAISVYPSEYRVKLESPKPLWNLAPRKKTDFVFRILNTLLPEDSSGVAGAKAEVVITERKWEQHGQVEKEMHRKTYMADAFGKITFPYEFSIGGSYEINVHAADLRGNIAEFQDYVWIPDVEQGITYDPSIPVSTAQVALVPDKEEYRVGERAKVSAFLPQEEGDLFVGVYTNDFRRVGTEKITGAEKSFEVPITEDLVPGFFLFAETYNGDSFFTGTRKMNVIGKKLSVEITPKESPLYPKMRATLSVLTKDEFGNPVASENAVTVVDKAILALRHYTDPKLFDAFYPQPQEFAMRRFTTSDAYAVGGAEKGGCFLSGTRILMADGTTKPIEEIRIGDEILTRESEFSGKMVKDRVVRTFRHEVGEYIVINGWLKVTPVHRMFVSGAWKTAGEIKTGDWLLDNKNGAVRVDSLEKVTSLVPVYNFETLRYHTYFAGGVYVHNDKGGDERPRKDFLDTAYWNAFVKTGSDGRAEVSFDVPDNLTTWVALGKGITSDTKVGEGEGEFTVTKDLFLRPMLPLFARAGDELEILGVIQNTTANDLEVEALIKADGAEVVSQSVRELAVSAKSSRQVVWKVRAGREKEMKFEFSVKQKGGKLVDNLMQTVPLYPALTPYTRAVTGVAPGEVSIRFDHGKEADASLAKAVLTLNSSALSILPEVIEKLAGYPYGCVEQTMTKHLPNILVKKYHELLGIEVPEDIEKNMAEGFDRLQKYQHDDGSFGWWEYDEASVWMTGYVLEGMVEIKDMGFLVGREKMYERTLEYLKGRFKDLAGEEKAYAGYVLSRALPGEYKFEFSNAELSKLPPESLGYVALASHYNGQLAAAKRIVKDHILPRMEENHWEQSSGVMKDGHDNAMADRYLATGVNLSALLTIEGASEQQIRAVVAWLMDHREGYEGLWGSTRQSSQILFALLKFIQKYDEFDPDFSYTVKMDGEEVAKGRAKSKKFSKKVKLPAKKMINHLNGFTFETEGKGTLYYTITTTSYLPSAYIPRPADSGAGELSISRSYYRNGAAVDPKDIKVGDVLTVELSVYTSESRRYVMIEDRLPSGFDVIHDRLAVDNQGEWEFSNADIRDERVTIFESYLWHGDRKFTYRVRAARAGKFSVPAPRVEPMYQPTIYAVGQETEVEIK